MSIPKVRAVCTALSKNGTSFQVSQVIKDLCLTTRSEKNKVYDAFRTMEQTGEVKRLGQGEWFYIGKKASKTKKVIMWRILRSRKTVTTADLEELTGVSHEYADEWLRLLTRQGIVDKRGSKFRLIKDPVKIPKDTSNAEKCRIIRRKKKLQAYIEAMQDLLNRDLTDTVKLDIANTTLNEVVTFLKEDQGC